jgi:hypothetical protein
MYVYQVPFSPSKFAMDMIIKKSNFVLFLIYLHSRMFIYAFYMPTIEMRGNGCTNSLNCFYWVSRVIVYTTMNLLGFMYLLYRLLIQTFYYVFICAYYWSSTEFQHKQFTIFFRAKSIESHLIQWLQSKHEHE